MLRRKHEMRSGGGPRWPMWLLIVCLGVAAASQAVAGSDERKGTAGASERSPDGA